MKADIIRMDSFPRSAGHAWELEAELKGFLKALHIIKSLNSASMRETIIALENFEASSILSREEVDGVYRYFGWRRGE